MTVNDIVQLADTASIIAVLTFILIAGVRKWWVFGWQYREKAKECEEWKSLALTGTRIAEHVAATVPKRRRRDDREVDA